MRIMIGNEPAERFEDLNEAWDAFIEQRFKGRAIDADTYHLLRVTYLSACVSSLNVFTFRYSKMMQQGNPPVEAVTSAMLQTLNEALGLIKEELKS